MIKSAKERLIRIPAAIVIALLFLLCFYVPVSADIGPKPSIRIKVKNPPEGVYYIALLSQKGGIRTNLSERDLKPEDKDIAQFFKEYSKDGYHVFFNPTSSNIQKNNSENSYRFYYMVPDTFKVLLLTVDGKEYVSNTITKKAFNADCTFDAASGELTEQIFTKYNIHSALIGTFVCFTATVLTEMAVLPMFALPFKKNMKHFWFINTVTQVFLNAVLLISSDLRIWAAAELVIIAVETLYYRNRLVNRNGEHNKKRNESYAIVANVISLIHELPLALIVNLIMRYKGWR